MKTAKEVAAMHHEATQRKFMQRRKKGQMTKGFLLDQAKKSPLIGIEEKARRAAKTANRTRAVEMKVLERIVKDLILDIIGSKQSWSPRGSSSSHSQVLHMYVYYRRPDLIQAS